MTVAELIVKLQAFPPNTKVATYSGSDYSEADDVETIDLVDRGGWSSRPQIKPPLPDRFSPWIMRMPNPDKYYEDCMKAYYEGLKRHTDDEARKQAYVVIT